MGLSDYDADNDGWSIIGRTADLSLVAEAIPSLFLDDTGKPYALININKKGCRAISATKMSVVKKNESRPAATAASLPVGATCR